MVPRALQHSGASDSLDPYKNLSSLVRIQGLGLVGLDFVYLLFLRESRSSYVVPLELIILPCAV